MPYPNFHACRLKDPSLFSKIIVLQTLPNGVMIYGGQLKSNPNGKPVAQAYRFPLSKFTYEQAKKWMIDHGFKKWIMFEKATGKTQAFLGSLHAAIKPMLNFHISRFLNPDTMDKNSFRVKTRDNEEWPKDSGKLRTIILVIAKPKGKAGASDPTKLIEFRYPIKKWTVAEARAHAKHNKATSFKAAKESVKAFNVRLLLKNIHSFNQDKIIELIPQNVYDKIIEKDPHPFFAVYSICHEGVSSPVILNEGPKKIAWPRKAIQSIKNLYIKGVRLFKGHNKDSSHSGRKVIGRVIHSFEKEIEGKLHHIVITYHPPKYRNEVKDLDVCSQESEWNFFDYAGQLVAESIEKLTGIALANSKEQIPAFAEAKRLGYIQAFDSFGKNASNRIGETYMAKKRTDQDVDNIFDQNNDSDYGNQDDNRQFPQNYPPQGYYYPPPYMYPYPSQNPNNQPQDFRNFNQPQDFQEGQKQNNQNQYPMYPPSYPPPPPPRHPKNKTDSKPLTYEQLKNEAKRMKVMPSQLFTEADLRADREFVNLFSQFEMAQEDNEKKDRMIEELVREKDLTTAQNRIGDFISDDKIPEEIAAFIIKRFEENKDRIDDLSDNGLKSFVKSQTELFQETAKIVNPEYDIKKNKGDGKRTGDVDDYKKAANNELLDSDIDE